MGTHRHLRYLWGNWAHAPGTGTLYRLRREKTQCNKTNKNCTRIFPGIGPISVPPATLSTSRVVAGAHLLSPNSNDTDEPYSIWLAAKCSSSSSRQAGRRKSHYFAFRPADSSLLSTPHVSSSQTVIDSFLLCSPSRASSTQRAKVESENLWNILYKFIVIKKATEILNYVEMYYNFFVVLNPLLFKANFYQSEKHFIYLYLNPDHF